MDTPTKIPTKPDQPQLVESRTLEERLALFPSLCGANPTGKKTSMTPFACHLLTNKGTGPSRSRRPRLEYPVDDSPVKPIPEPIAQAFAKDTDSIFKTYKGPRRNGSSGYRGVVTNLWLISIHYLFCNVIYVMLGRDMMKLRFHLPSWFLIMSPW